MEEDKTSKWFWIFSKALEIDGPCSFYTYYVGTTCDKWSLGHLCECIFGSSPIRRVRTIFPLANPENCPNLPVQLTLCQLVVQLAPVAYMRLNMKCLNTNTSEPLEQCSVLWGRPVFSCNSNHKIMFSSKREWAESNPPIITGQLENAEQTPTARLCCRGGSCRCKNTFGSNEDIRNLRTHYVGGIY